MWSDIQILPRSWLPLFQHNELLISLKSMSMLYGCPKHEILSKDCSKTWTLLSSYRLTFSDPPPSRSTSLLKMGSKFRYSDRTLYQLHKDGHPIKDQPKFSRVSSLNWSRRYQMPSLSETRIYVDEKDDDRKKRPLSEGDMPSKMPLYIRKGVQVHVGL